MVRHGVDDVLFFDFFSVVGLVSSLVSRLNIVLDCPLVLLKVVSDCTIVNVSWNGVSKAC